MYFLIMKVNLVNYSVYGGFVYYVCMSLRVIKIFCSYVKYFKIIIFNVIIGFKFL